MNRKRWLHRNPTMCPPGSGSNWSTRPSQLRTTRAQIYIIDHVSPGGRTMADVRIQVPRDASRGERYAAVWAEISTPPKSGVITQVSRVGIRIYLSVGPGGAPPSDFEITSLTPGRAGDGSPVVRATVRNTG